MSMMNLPVQGQSILTASAGTSATQAMLTTSTGLNYDTTQQYAGTAGGLVGNTSLWNYWQGPYYEQVIYPSYPIYVREKAMDKGKQAFEICKSLMDKDLIRIEKVKDFVEAMDTILKTL